MKWLMTGVAAVALLASMQSAHAIAITNGSPASLTYNLDKTVTSGNTTADLTGSVVFSNFSFAVGTAVGGGTITRVIYNTTVKNTTTQGSLSTSDFNSVRLTGFGYDVDPNAIAAADNSTVYNTFLNTNFPSFNQVDICLSVQTCPGGANGGLSPGGSDTFTQTLTFNGAITTFDFGIGASEQLATKWQTGFGSFEFAGNPCTTNCGSNPPPPPPPGTVPEPHSIMALGSGLLGMTGLLWYRRRQDEA